MKKTSILLVEDEAMSAILLKRNLQFVGYDVYGPVSTGQAAIDIIKEASPDVVLMDVNLGDDMDGIETAEKILATYNIPVIFMTGYDDQETKNRAQALQPVAYLIKPVTPHDIDPIITTL